jgi:uncharacterized protein with PQ loop repeat
MATSTLPVVAGMVSTTVFAGSMLPMLLKAARTRNLSSYSIGNLVLANIGNAVHSVYVFHLPAGPIWFLHGFYLLTSALMLCWWVRYRPDTRRGGADGTPTGAAVLGSAAAAAGAPGRNRARRAAVGERVAMATSTPKSAPAARNVRLSPTTANFLIA